MASGNAVDVLAAGITGIDEDKQQEIMRVNSCGLYRPPEKKKAAKPGSNQEPEKGETENEK